MDNALVLVSLGLLALNVFQLVFWSRDHHKLVDKLMSRNYPEYIQSKSREGTAITQQPVQTNKDFESIEEEKVILDEVNSIFGR